MRDQDRKIKEVRIANLPSCQTLKIEMERKALISLTFGTRADITLFDLTAEDYYAIMEGCDTALQVLELENKEPEEKEEEGEANANLIVAAPELLKACKAALLNKENGEYECQRKGYPRMIEVLEMLRQAITKAEGGEKR